MEQEDKQLLLKDLCARLAYGVKCRQHKLDSQVCTMCPEYLKNAEDVEEYEPYLRPMSSMTEKEKRKYDILVEEIVYRPGVLTCSSLINFCYEHHLDDLGLIEKGLALVAPKDMYKTE